MKRLKTRIDFNWNLEGINVKNIKNSLEQRKRGTILHLALSMVDRKSGIDNFKKLIEKALVIKGEKPQEWNCDELAKMLERAVDTFFFSDDAIEIYKEREILIPMGKGFEVLRPDRIVFFRDKVVIVDFKISRPTQEVGKIYRDQVIKYTKAIKSLTNKPAKGYLLYIEEAVYEEVC